MAYIAPSSLEESGHIINGGGDSLSKWPNFRLSRARDLDLDLGSGHTAYRHASLMDLCMARCITTSLCCLLQSVVVAIFQRRSWSSRWLQNCKQHSTGEPIWLSTRQGQSDEYKHVNI